MATENLIVKYMNSKTKPRLIHKLKAITTAMNWTDQTTEITQKSRPHTFKSIYIYIYIPFPPSSMLLTPTIPRLYNIVTYQDGAPAE